ncbi:hypothetical protein [Cystobacter ferrugineus]|uniref:Lipoprotein n=1 Tax=Cystobacter ferrugineus TaxID=83449 RepID=A0A1L9BB06_9BACT|nr:hypothetical protein [Cystobacter ferrugineus]OJH39446.1 hypothetical protein BON30_18265 [Cystobacter ferrugineus]
MPSVKSTVLLLLPLFLLACGVAPPAEEQPLVTEAAALHEAEMVGCRFLVSSRQKQGPMPPQKQIVVTREGVEGLEGCAWGNGSVVLGTTYDDSSLSLAANNLGVAVGFTSKSSPSGSAAVFVQLRHLDPQSLAVLRSTSLGALNQTQVGNVNDVDLSVGKDGTTLEVRGSKNGTIPGEVGSGSNYLARFPDFFTSTLAPTITAEEE